MNFFKPLFYIILFFTLSARAQMPVLKVQGSNQQESISLPKVKIDVQIFGAIAKTEMTMTFYNNSSRILEGELTFPMPEGVTVSSYSIDVNGKMRKAVPIEKARAVEVFESIESRRIDPGLLEKVEGNSFRTRIYPIPAKGSRTITIGYEEELKINQKEEMKYHLPLDYPKTIADFSLKTTIYETMYKPELVEQPDGSFDLKSLGNMYFAEMKKVNFRPKNGVTINLPKRGSMPEVQMQKASSGHYFLLNVFPERKSRPHHWANRLGIIWDASLSGLQRDIKKELALLDLIIKRKQDITVSLGLLNNTFKNAGTFQIKNGDWRVLREQLEKVVYDGGTNYSSINPRALVADEYLFFTDGLSSFGKNSVFLNKPVHTINSCSRADHSTLKLISMKSGGDFVNLRAASIEEAFSDLNEEQLKYLGIKNNADVRETYPSLPVDVNGHLSVAGILSRYATKVTLQFGYGNQVVTEQVVALDPNAQALSNWDVSRIWAQKKIAELDVQYDLHKDDISALSKQFGIVTRNTSLIVLENVEDYVRYGITPPKELSFQYAALIKQKNATLIEQRKNLLNVALTMTSELKNWWNTDFDTRKKKVEKYPTPDSAQSVVQEAAVSSANQRMAMRERVDAVRMEVASQTSALQGRVAGLAAQRVQIRDKALNSPAPQPTISVKEFRSDKDYMKSLVGVGNTLYENYLAVRPAYVNNPQFYFDVANYFFQQADSTRALMILSNIADLDLENASLYKVLAYKLKQTGNFRSALFITEKILQWRPMDAQSYRDYALALADVGGYQGAIDNLYKILLRSYNEETSSRDEGIEETIIAEINSLISRYGRLTDTKSIDKRLIQALPVDIRVVLNWNKKDTDIDLWVTDPRGEKCYYSSPESAIGGRLSNDFTSGYGPEQFMLKKAIKGKYKIEVNFYGDNSVTVEGPTTVTAEIYLHYGTPKEQRKIIVLPLYGKEQTGRLVGEFDF